MPKSREELLAIRSKVAKEILSTERSYVESMSALVDVYIRKLSSLSKKEEILSKEEISIIFGNIELIVELNIRFLASLEQVMENFDDNSCLGDCFAQYFPWFKMYVTYCTNQGSAVKYYRKLAYNRSSVKNFEEQAMLSPRCKGLSLESHLIMPIQRIPRYRLLLENIVSHTPEDHPDYKKVKEMLGVISGVAAKINEEIRRAEQRDRVLEIQDLFRGKIQLVTPNRIFKLSGELTKICRKSDKVFHFFLFNDLLIYGVPLPSGSYLLHREFLIDASFLVADIPSSSGSCEFCFQIRNSKKSFVVYAKDQVEKDTWLKAFNEAIEESSNSTAPSAKNKSEMAPIWVPDKLSKECALCKLSFSMINRKHHCRKCGSCICGSCSKKRLRIPNSGSQVRHRVCDKCAVDIIETQEQHRRADSHSKSIGTNALDPGVNQALYNLAENPTTEKVIDPQLSIRDLSIQDNVTKEAEKACNDNRKIMPIFFSDPLNEKTSFPGSMELSPGTKLEHSLSSPSEFKYADTPKYRATRLEFDQHVQEEFETKLFRKAREDSQFDECEEKSASEVSSVAGEQDSSSEDENIETVEESVEVIDEEISIVNDKEATFANESNAKLRERVLPSLVSSPSSLNVVSSRPLRASKDAPRITTLAERLMIATKDSSGGKGVRYLEYKKGDEVSVFMKRTDVMFVENKRTNAIGWCAIQDFVTAPQLNPTNVDNEEDEKK